jgi:chromosome segregation ATPase
MDATRTGIDSGGDRFDGLHAEAKAALGSSTSALRSIRERYNGAYLDEFGRWQALRDELDARERSPAADDERLAALRAEVESLTTELGEHQTELSKLELAQRSLENAWLFLERGDVSLIGGDAAPGLTADVQMRIVEA